jgi:phosphate-selective porin OprO and OprP
MTLLKPPNVRKGSNMSKFKLVLAAGTALALVCAGAAGAQTVQTAHGNEAVDPRDAKLDALTAQVQALAAEVQALRAAAADAKTSAHAVEQKVAAAPKVSEVDGRPTITSADGSSKIALRSVAQFDIAKYNVSPLTAANDLGSGSGVRRARLGIDGAYKDWNYALWGEFGGSGGESAVLNQAYVEYAGWRPAGLSAPVRLRIGATAAPSSLEDATSNTDNLFLERSAVAELVRGLDAGDGRTSVGLFVNDQRWYASAVLTGKVAGVPSTPEYDQQRGFVLRGAVNALHGADYDVHLGAALQGVLDPADTVAGPGGAQAIRLAERPESRVTAVKLVDTGAISADGATISSLEAGASWGAFYADAEAFWIDVNRTAVGAAHSPFNPSFSGWEAEAAFTLTGERRVWGATNGAFSGIRPRHAFDLASGQYGAWETAIRFSDLNLNDHAGAAGSAAPLGGVRGGDQKITSLGLNWYPNNVLRFLLDYQWVKVRRLSATGANIGEDVNTLSLRSQFAF